MNEFRQIQPTQPVVPVRKPRDVVNKKQQQPKKENPHPEQQPEDKSEHHIDEHI